jgi:hypothetical protein
VGQGGLGGQVGQVGIVWQVGQVGQMGGGQVGRGQYMGLIGQNVEQIGLGGQLGH